MPNSKPFPSKEADLNTYFNLAIPYLLNNATRLLVSPDNQNTLSVRLAAWNTAYPLSQNPNTRTVTTTATKDAARDDAKETLRIVFADIPESALTDADRTTLNLPERSTSRTPAPVPSTKPIGQVDTSKRLEHTIRFTDEDGSAAKPEGVRGCQIWMKIGSPATDPSELSYVATDTRSPYVYHFEGKDAGKAVYYWLRWENTRGETGPWSDSVMATIVG
jgi:hypothetical protein